MKATGESLKDLDAAVERARLLMTLDEHGPVAAVADKPGEVEQLK